MENGVDSSFDKVHLDRCSINRNPMCALFFLIICVLWNGFTTVSTIALKFPENINFTASLSIYKIEGTWNINGKNYSKVLINSDATSTASKFPENVTFGTSTSSYPIEGTSTVDSKHFSKGLIHRGTTALKFPENFIFGASTSSYQIEGAWNVDGKGENIWDRLTHTKPDAIKDGTNGDDAAKSYYLYKNDSDLIKEIGFDMYRFSISWTRILPNGDLSEINQAGIQHYNDVINDLLEKNIEPMVTIYHWDLPQKLQDQGGWMNSSIVDHLANYADILFSNFGDRVKWWSTINEPYFVVYGYSHNNSNAPSLGLGTPANYIVTHHILLSHMRIYRLYEKKYKSQQNGKISISINYEMCFPKTGSQEDIEAAERNHQFSLGIFAHPIYSEEGNYPKLVREVVYNNSIQEGLTKSRLPEFTEEEITLLKGASDYFSFNHYSSLLCSSVSENEPQNTTSPYFQDINAHVVDNVSLAINEELDSKGFRIILYRISTDYNFPEILVTENGYGYNNGEIDDQIRIKYLQNYLSQLLEVYYYGNSRIIGYIVWSILDDFEWTLGYELKYGLISVDYNSTNKERTRKQSSYFVQELLKTRTLQ